MRQVTPNIAPPLAVSWPARWTDAVAIMGLDPATLPAVEARLRSMGLLAAGVVDLSDPRVEAVLGPMVKRAAPKAKAKAAPPPPLPARQSAPWVEALDTALDLLQVPEPGRGSARVALHAAGLCARDWSGTGWVVDLADPSVAVALALPADRGQAALRRSKEIDADIDAQIRQRRSLHR